eukprot:gene6399-1140_t
MLSNANSSHMSEETMEMMALHAAPPGLHFGTAAAYRTCRLGTYGGTFMPDAFDAVRGMGDDGCGEYEADYYRQGLRGADLGSNHWEEDHSGPGGPPQPERPGQDGLVDGVPLCTALHVLRRVKGHFACAPCGKWFKTLAAMQQHSRDTGHLPPEMTYPAGPLPGPQESVGNYSSVDPNLGLFPNLGRPPDPPVLTVGTGKEPLPYPGHQQPVCSAEQARDPTEPLQSGDRRTVHSLVGSAYLNDEVCEIVGRLSGEGRVPARILYGEYKGKEVLVKPGNLKGFDEMTGEEWMLGKMLGTGGSDLMGGRPEPEIAALWHGLTLDVVGPEEPDMEPFLQGIPGYIPGSGFDPWGVGDTIKHAIGGMNLAGIEKCKAAICSGRYHAIVCVDIQSQESEQSAATLFERHLGPTVRAFAEAGGAVAFPTSFGDTIVPILRRIFGVVWETNDHYWGKWEHASGDIPLNFGPDAPVSFGAKSHGLRNVPKTERMYGSRYHNERALGDGDDYDVSVAVHNIGSGSLVYFGERNMGKEIAQLVA